MDLENLPIIQTVWDTEAARAFKQKMPIIPRELKFKKEDVLQDVAGIYHVIGGAARLAHTADEDPKWFYKTFKGQLLPAVKQEVDHTHHIYPPLPPSPLDGEWTEAEVTDVQHESPSADAAGPSTPDATADAADAPAATPRFPSRDVTDP